MLWYRKGPECCLQCAYTSQSQRGVANGQEQLPVATATSSVPVRWQQMCGMWTFQCQASQPTYCLQSFGIPQRKGIRPADNCYSIVWDVQKVHIPQLQETVTMYSQKWELHLIGANQCAVRKVLSQLGNGQCTHPYKSELTGGGGVRKGAKVFVQIQGLLQSFLFSQYNLSFCTFQLSGEMVVLRLIG